jgi:peptide/nickel transport system permease protein
MSGPANNYIADGLHGQDGQLADFWRRFRRNRGALIGALIAFVFLFLSIFGPVIAPYDPLEGSLEDRIKPPSRQHLLGTDDVGRDVLSRIINGARISLEIMIVSVIIALLIGVFFGVLGGYYGGLVDNIVMRLMDILLAFPSIFLAIAIIAILGPGLTNVMLAAGLYSVPQFARISRASVLYLKEMEFVEAAKAAGESSIAVIFYHILPNALAPLIIQTTLRMATVLLTASGLSFLGLGVQPPAPEWGAMLANGRTYIMVAPHVATFPGLAILLVVIGFNLLGDGLRDSLDPRLKD